MSENVEMPALGESVTEGTVTQWLKQVGDSVEVDEPLLEVSTDKVDTEVPSPVAGTVQEILVQEDETVEVGTVLAVVGDGAAPPAQDSAPAQETPAEPEPTPEPEPAPAQPEPTPQPAAQPAASGGVGGENVEMPALGESVTEGTVTQWLKQVGDSVEVDEPLLEVSTDKVDTEVPSPVAGTVQEILVQEDETVEVGTVLAVVGDGAAPPAQDSAPAQETPAEPESTPEPEPAPAQPEPTPQPAAQPAATPAAGPAPASEDTSTAPETPVAGGSSGYVTPLVRKMANENNIDISTITGTGVGGRIRKQDVQEVIDQQKAAEQAPQASTPPASQPANSSRKAPEPSPLRGKTEKMSRRRKIIAERMVESLQVSAQLTTVVEVDLTRVARLRERAKAEFKEREGVNLSYLSFLTKAAVESLKAHPKINATIDGDEVTYHGAEHLGMAVDTEQGLVVPVIRDAGDLNIAGIARKIADVAARTRSNKIGPDELAGGSFTITNTGSRGALFDTPIINQPQVAILGTGAIVKRPVVVSDGDGGETIAIRSMIYLALSYDHRLVDGADAARFLGDVKDRLEEGEFEGDLGL